MRRTNLTTFVYVLGLIIASQAQAGYRDMKQEVETYTPPSYFQDLTRPSPEREESIQDTVFAAELQKITQIKSQWLKSLSRAEAGAVFFQPDDRLLGSLRPAGTDTHAAGEALKGEFTLATLATLALLRSPKVKASENRLRASIEAFSQVQNLDEILRQYTAFTEGLMTGVGPMKGKDPVNVAFPFPGVLALKGQIVQQEVKAAREDLEAARRETVTAARIAYWNLLFMHKAQKITAETIGLFRRLEAVASTRYEAGKTSFQDVIRIRIKREILDEELVTLREKQHNLESQIREILNLDRDLKIGFPQAARPVEKFPTQQTLYKIARERRQELRRLRANIGKMERMIEMTETMVLPPYTLDFSLYEDEAILKVGPFASKDTFPTSIEVSRGAGLPKMSWYGIQDAYLRETRQKLDALREDLKQTEASTENKVRFGWFEMDRARREMSLFKNKVVNLSKSALDVTTRGYESGSVPFADVIAAHTIWLDANLSLANQQSRLGVAWAELEQVVGTSLK
jgi:cobalt-zinc-cadmium efflux system outer membrane protein